MKLNRVVKGSMTRLRRMVSDSREEGNTYNFRLVDIHSRPIRIE